MLFQILSPPPRIFRNLIGLLCFLCFHLGLSARAVFEEAHWAGHYVPCMEELQQSECLLTVTVSSIDNSLCVDRTASVTFQICLNCPGKTGTYTGSASLATSTSPTGLTITPASGVQSYTLSDMQCTQVTFDLQATQNFLDENNGIGLLFGANLNVDGTIVSSPNLNPFLPIGIPPDLADFETEADEENCRVQFTSLGDEELINTHSWDFGDGSSGSTLANPVHTFPGSGTYIVTHTVSNFCGTVVEEIEVEVNCPFTCPCIGAGAINIDAGSGLSILNTPIPSLVASTGFGPQTLVNTCLAINGRLLIDQLYDLVILGGEIRMQPGAEIVVQNGSELDLIAIIANNGIHGCEQMWQGITVLNGGFLIMNSVNIEDAQYAVEVNDGSTLDVTFTEFDRNYVGIYVPHSPGGSLQVVNQPFPLQKNSFTCSSSLLPPFVGQSPNPGTISFAGIQLNNVFFNVGSSSVPTATNDFSLVKNGIVAENQSVVGVFNASFLNLEGTVNIDLTIPSSAAFTGIGVYLNETYAYAVDNNSFTGDDDRAIHANNSSLFAKQNTAKTFIGISIEEGNFNLIDIQKNKFDFIKRGIQVLNTEAPSFFDIDQNIFTHLVAGPPSSLTRGITIIEPTISSSLSILKRINRNQFNLTNYSAGIGLFNSWEYDVNYNNIFFSNPNLSPPLGGQPIGISISGGGNNLLYQDTISAGNLSDRVAGFNWVSSPGNTLCCNLASNLLTAFGAQGPCDNTRLRNSIIENNFRGLSCSRGTIISDQNFAGNLWTGTYSDYSARHFGSLMEIGNSEFYIEPPIAAPLWPINPIPVTSWFFTSPLGSSTTCTTDENCLPIPPQEREETELNTTDSETARGAFLEASFGATSDWEMKRSLYRRLSRHEQLTGQNAIVDSFFLANGNTSLGDFQNVDEQIASSLRVDAATLAQLSFYKSSIDSSTTQMAVIDSLYAYAFTPEDSVQLAQQKAALLNQLISLSENLMATFMTLKVNRESQTNQILGMNEAINASILPAQNLKAVTRIYLETASQSNFTLDPDQFAEVTAIAEQCPLVGGSAVYQARALYQMHEVRDFDDSVYCESVAPRATMPKQRVTSTSMTILPNPADQYLLIQLPTEDLNRRIRLLDTNGRSLGEWMVLPDANQQQIRTSELPAGLYLIQLWTNGRIVDTQRIVIVH